MKQLNFKSALLGTTVTALNALQARLNQQGGYEQQCIASNSAWQGKENTDAGERAFVDIRRWLLEATTGNSQCNYCEQNEAVDIEHVFPKSIFPDRTFKHDNYLMACPICNSRYKKDDFEVFDPAGNQVDVNQRQGKKRIYKQPISQNPVMLDPTREDTLAYFHLDIDFKSFNFTPRNPDPKHPDTIRAIYTCALLGLNRSELSGYRRDAAKFYLAELGRYVNAKQASNYAELEAVLTDLDTATDPLDHTKPFGDEQSRILGIIKNNIQTAAHPSVWCELIRQRANLRRTNTLLDKAPEAISW